MARLNLTVPDALYERLERLRDRVNVSKVCAIALEKELNMLEGSTIMVPNPKAQRLIERLQGQKARKDQWFQLGYEAGENWMAEIAEIHDIRHVLDEWEIEDEERYTFDDVEFPDSFDCQAAIARSPTALRSEPSESAETPAIAGATAADEVDQDAFVRGWHRAVRDLWKAAGPVLRWDDE